MKALLLLSGGIDSPVAGYLLKKQAVEVGAIHFSNEPITDKEGEEKTRKLAKIIGIKDFYVVKNFGKILGELSTKCEHRYYFVIMRRFMYRIAEKIALEKGYDVLATGENLGQVGSQTLQNMKATSASIKMKVLRPVLCNDKMETVKTANEIGTFETSKGPELCAVLGPKNPITKAKIEKLIEEEARVDVDAIVSSCVKDTVYSEI
jgi:tRNA uracil 4-sulfurtransferase